METCRDSEFPLRGFALYTRIVPRYEIFLEPFEAAPFALSLYRSMVLSTATSHRVVMSSNAYLAG
jgi:hypothetical protein